jgi:coenzyme PQQ precursor peptide PqqA
MSIWKGEPVGAANRFSESLWSRQGKTLELNTIGRAMMREWHKPTVEETESGMEVTSYLPAELDRA